MAKAAEGGRRRLEAAGRIRLTELSELQVFVPSGAKTLVLGRLPYFRRPQLIIIVKHLARGGTDMFAVTILLGDLWGIGTSV